MSLHYLTRCEECGFETRYEVTLDRRPEEEYTEGAKQAFEAATHADSHTPAAPFVLIRVLDGKEEPRQRVTTPPDRKRPVNN